MKLLAVDHTATLSCDRELYRVLQSHYGMNVTLLIPSSRNESHNGVSSEPELSAIKVISSPTLFAGKVHRMIYTTFGKTLRDIQPDILYVNAEPENYLALQAAYLRKKYSPHSKLVIISWRNIDYPDGVYPYKFPSSHALAERHVLRHIDHCIAHNQRAKEIYHRKGIDTVSVIPPSVNTKIFFPEERQQFVFTIAYIGRFVQEKGIHVLLAAIQHLPFDFRLVLIGNGPERSALEKLAKDLQLTNRISIQSSVSHFKIPEVLRGCDVLILPSLTGKFWKEQFGRVLIEAMACGVPVIGSDSGEIPSVIGDAGIIVVENDAQQLTQAIIKLHDDNTLRRRYQRLGIERVQLLYSVEAVARQYVALFSRLVS